MRRRFWDCICRKCEKIRPSFSIKALFKNRFFKMPAINTLLAQRVLETALLCAQRALTIAELRVLFDGDLGADTIKDCLLELQQRWSGRGVELVMVASGWRFQSRADMREFLDRLNPEKIPPYKSAELQVLATIAWRQPVTLGDIADIRGVTATSADIIKRFEDRGWIEVVGRRETSGARLFGTTRKFLDDLGLASLQDLPALDELATSAPPDFERLALKHPELDWSTLPELNAPEASEVAPVAEAASVQETVLAEAQKSNPAEADSVETNTVEANTSQLEPTPAQPSLEPAATAAEEEQANSSEFSPVPQPPASTEDDPI